jgi:hypothetical protein
MKSLQIQMAMPVMTIFRGCSFGRICEDVLIKARVGLILLTALGGVALSPNVDAADFVFRWKASSEPFVSSYGVYQRIGDGPYQGIDVIRVADLDDPAHPSHRITGLIEGNTYWFAATGISASNVESDLSSQTCVTVNGQAVECSDDDDESGASIIVSCFIRAVDEGLFPETRDR